MTHQCPTPQDDPIAAPARSAHAARKPISCMCEPAVNWSQGIPLGNGRLGVMIWGGPFETYLSLNADRLWRNKFPFRLQDRSDVFERIRQLCRQGQWAQAEALSAQLTPSGAGVNPYQPAAQIRISARHNAGAQQYRRQLDLNDAVCTIRYRACERQFEWQSFVSAVDDVSVTRIRPVDSALLPVLRIDLVRQVNDPSLAKAKLQADGSANVQFDEQRQFDHHCEVNVWATPDHIAVLTGRFNEGVSFAAACTILADGPAPNLFSIPGTVLHAPGYRTEITRARSVILLTTVYVDSECDNPADQCQSRLRALRTREYTDLYAAHVADYQFLSARCTINLGDSELTGNPETAVDIEPASLDNAQLLRQSRETQAPFALWERIFEMGRYLMISGSRPGTLPLNLQGIWNNDLAPAWDCDFHFDLNIQQSYWPVEVTNLSECHLPLADLLHEHMPAYRRNAEKIYGMRGLMMPGSSDLTGRFAVGFWHSWPSVAAWMAQHLWWHWEYSQDKDFLRTCALPFMAEAIRFYLDYVQQEPDGRIFISPTFSPENKADDRNSYYGRNATIDLVLIDDLLRNYVQASRHVVTDAALTAQCQAMLKKWPKPKIDSDGKLCEMEDATFDHFHRHLSHLVGLYPGSQITPETDARLIDAYKKAMEHRKHYGFDDWMSFTWAWMGLLHARLGEAQEAMACLEILARAFFMDNLLCGLFDAGRLGWGTLWADTSGDTPRLFQIEGGLGATALIAEMLLQSHNGLIRILPALPKCWPQGRFHGLVARGGFVVSAEWADGVAHKIEITSPHGGPVIVRITAPLVRIIHNGQILQVVHADQTTCTCSFSTIRAGRYILIPGKQQ